AAGARRGIGAALDDLERLPRPRPSELDPQLRPLRARRLSRKARPRDCGTAVRSHGKVRVMRKRIFVLAGVLALMSGPASAATKPIRAAKVVDASGKVSTNVVIVVDNDRITSIGTPAPPAGAEVIDLTRYTIIPGLIDLHTHVTYYWDRAPGTRPLSQP